MKEKIDKLIHKELEYIFKSQNPDGGFSAYIISNDDAEQNHASSNIVTAAVISSLSNIKKNKVADEISAKAANYLLSQKSENWTFTDLGGETSRDTLNATFFCLSSLMLYNKKLIDGEAIAKILMILTACEEKEGGPYKNWRSHDSNGSHKIDLGANANIAYFLSLHDVELPEINKFISDNIKNENFSSVHYPGIINVLYLISRLGEKKYNGDIIKILDKTGGDNPMALSLLSSSLINLGASPAIFEKNFSRLLSFTEDEIHKPFSFYNHEAGSCPAGSPVLTSTLYIEALNKFIDSDALNEKITIISSEEAEKLYNSIVGEAKQKFLSCGDDLKKQAIAAIDKIVKKDEDRQIILLSYFFNKSLALKNQILPIELIKKLGVANLFLWTAYTIYDDFLDDEGDPKLLSVANICLREFSITHHSILPEIPEYQAFFSKIMDILDSANAWEISSCRSYATEDKFYFPEAIPDFNNFDKLSERSIAHALGPIAIMFYLGLGENSDEIKNIMNFFKNYLSARQLNDDAHDWEDDLKKGHINSVAAEILKRIEGKKHIDFAADLTEIKKQFWFEIIDEVSRNILEKIEAAETALNSIKLIENSGLLTGFTDTTKKSAERALEEKIEFVKFLNVYEEKN